MESLATRPPENQETFNFSITTTAKLDKPMLPHQGTGYNLTEVFER